MKPTLPNIVFIIFLSMFATVIKAQDSTASDQILKSDTIRKTYAVQPDSLKTKKMAKRKKQVVADSSYRPPSAPPYTPYNNKRENSKSPDPNDKSGWADLLREILLRNRHQ